VIDRRKFLLALPALYAASARAQTPAGKTVRVGLFVPTTAAKYQVLEKSFVDAMRELGWIEDRNVTYDRVYGDDDMKRLPALATALVTRGPALIYTASNPVTLAALAKTHTIPIVFSTSNDPVEFGLVKSLAHPGGNVTGVANIGFELGGKRLQLLKQALPKIARVGVLVHPSLPESPRELKLIESAATPLGITVIPVTVKEPAGLDAGFALLTKHRVEALLTTHISMFLTNRKRILEFAATRRTPVIGHRGQFADDGALMSYSSILTEQIRRAAQLADKILKGAKPADIPVEQPPRFELVVNLKTARALAIKMPGEIMLQATRVIE